MAAATASLSRLAAGAPTAAASGAPRGVRSAATGAAAGGMSAILAGEQQQYAPPPLRASHLASASYHSAAGCAHPGLAPQRLINLAAAAAAPPPSHLLSSGAASTPPCASLCRCAVRRGRVHAGRQSSNHCLRHAGDGAVAGSAHHPCCRRGLPAFSRLDTPSLQFSHPLLNLLPAASAQRGCSCRWGGGAW